MKEPETAIGKRPLVSVVTPFHNTAPYLAQCIESVLAQSYTQFEYILVDNYSTDGSTEIAEDYARRDQRIRFIRRPELLSQVQNYNRALAEISEASRYCKIVQADDFIFPDCLHSMVEAFEQSESIGLVSSYWLKGSEVRGSGFPYPTPMMSGKDMARLYLRTGIWVFGSPTAVMYRASLVKKSQPFYDESQLHEDTDKCMQILEHLDFGFVHRVLSFSRADNESISSAVGGFRPDALDRYLMVQRYAVKFLEAGEAAAVTRESERAYYQVLAQEALRGQDDAFWQYHAKGLSTLGKKIDRSYLAFRIAGDLLWNAGNPAAAIAKALRLLKRKMRGQGKKGGEAEFTSLPAPDSTPASVTKP